MPENKVTTNPPPSPGWIDGVPTTGPGPVIVIPTQPEALKGLSQAIYLS